MASCSLPDVASPETLLGSSRNIRLLSFVHLRNIHNSTGAGRVARQLTEHLAVRTDISIRILADRADHESIIPKVGAPWTSYEFALFDSDTSKQQARWFLLDRPRAQRFWPEAQIIHCTGESYVPKGKARLAVTVHDAAYFEDHAHQRDRAFRTQQIKWRFLYKKLERTADIFHVVSQFSADRLAHFFPSIKSRLKVVHNAVTPHFFEPVTMDGRAYLKEQGLDQRPYLLVPGGLHFRKNAELILEAWPVLRDLHPDLTIVIVNHSNPAYVQKLSLLGGNIRIAGFVSDASLKALYSGAQAVWFPSRYEGFGLPVVEAMACGTPVITSQASSLPEIGGRAAVYADPAAWKSHVDAIQGVLTDSVLRRQLAEQGKARAAQFTWTSSAAQLKDHFEALL